MTDVYCGLSQTELEIQYDARGSVTDFPSEMATYRRLSDHCYDSCEVVRDLAYGTGNDEKIDFFPAVIPGSPVFVFIHGGYWRFLGRPDSAFMAENFVGHGISVAVVEYTLAPAASLDQIVDQIRRAVAFLYDRGEHLGIDKTKIFIGGSSAGAHLCSMVLTTDWTTQFGLAVNPVRGALLASGLYDLEPVSLCIPNTWLKLDKAAIARNSPVHNLPRNVVDVLVTWGGLETDEFKKQSKEYAGLLQTAGFAPQLMQIDDRNHFDIVVDLSNATRQLFAEIKQMILEN
jgi:arylformamidase